MSTTLNATKDEVYQYFIIESHSIVECAQHFGLSRTTMTRKLREMGLHQDEDQRKKIKSKPSSRKQDIDKDLLYDLYIVQNLTIDAIAEKLHKSAGVILSRIKEYGFKKSGVQRAINTQKTLKEKYATEESRKKIADKRKKTCLQKYGTEYAIRSKSVQDQVKKTNQEKYGSESALSNSDVRSKISNTCISRYGHNVAAKSQKIQSKMKATCLKKYGVDNFGKSELHRLKVLYNGIARFHSDPDYIFNIVKSASDFKRFIVDHSLTTVKEISNALDGYSMCSIEKLLGQYKLWKLIPHATSNGEKTLCEFLDSLGVKHVKSRKVIPPYEIDCYCKDFRIGIEYNGGYYHSSACVDKKYHFEKSKLAESAGVRLIHVYEHEWTDPRTRPIIESMLKIAFHKITTKIYARNCEIREITNNEARPFNEANHIQGHRNAKVTYGLFYKGNLVQLMSFSHNRKYEWEIIRGCPGSNNIVVGGVSKLFKHFIREKNPKEVFSYADFNKFDGSGYLSLGMEFIGYTGPDLKWVINGQVISRQPQKHKELMSKAENQIWGAGSKKFLWKQ